MAEKLTEYHRKRDFQKTKEPKGTSKNGKAQNRFVIQKHDASRMHFDLRLEINGVYVSWAVPKGPSLNPANKRLAVHVEDHPLDYGTFEGTIPEGEYGGGTVMLWDEGTYTTEHDPQEEHDSGSMKIEFHGERMKGHWALVQMHTHDDKDEGKNWLLIKEKDDAVKRIGKDLPTQFMKSVKSNRTMAQIAKEEASDGGDADSEADPSSLRGAKKKAQPKSFKPQLAQLVSEAPEGDEWLHEIKFDGYRMLAFIENGKVRLMSRNDQDWSEKFGAVVDEIKQLGVKSAILDGEVVILDSKGVSDFGALQNYVQGASGQLTYFVFDVPYFGGYDLTAVPQLGRKEFLRQVLGGQNVIQFSDHTVGNGPLLFKSACENSLEGIISKRADAPYRQTRGTDWLKVKCIQRQEFVIGGYSDPGGSRLGFGALVLGYYDDKGDLIYCGRVGTGFDDKKLDAITKLLKALETAKSPFKDPIKGPDAKGVHYVEPKLVCEVEFTAWTGDKRLRHPSFKGMRADKPAKLISQEKPMAAPKKKEESSSGKVAGVNITHPERVIFEGADFTKLDLAEYFDAISEWILPHVANRPLALVRCPQGSEHECFFQKNFTDMLPDAVHSVDLGDAHGIGIEDEQGLVALAQFGVIEFHPWGSKEGDVEHPDRITFDLDPGPELGWEDVVNGAFETREVLEQLGLKTWVKTSGGKGLHICIPIKPNLDWETVKEFCHGIALLMEKRDPSRWVANMAKSKRTGRIFLDYLRNGRGATSAAAYSPRARAGGPVSVPVDWDEVRELSGAAHFNLASTIERVKKLKRDPWAEFLTDAQDLKAILKKSG